MTRSESDINTLKQIIMAEIKECQDFSLLRIILKILFHERRE